MARIWNQGIAERRATFQAEARSAAHVRSRVGDPESLVLVADRDGEVTGWAWLTPYDDADYYRGVRECTIYVERSARRHGVGTALLGRLATEAERRGHHKLTAKLFTTNAESIALFRRRGFREVGVHRRHGRLDGEWRDVLVLERPLGEASP